jgi:prepilin signal peptidase PulO-like enzyme (type II secretory pathway)
MTGLYATPVTWRNRWAIPAVFALWTSLCAWLAPDWATLVVALWASALLLSIALIDAYTRHIPDALIIFLVVCAIAQALALGHPALSSAALGAAAGGGAFYLLAKLGRGALGQGDVKLAFAVGALLGYPAVWQGLFAGVVAAGLAALFLLITRRAGRKDPMAYGPYLALGTWLVLTGFWLMGTGVGSRE